jgi:hypothetical protein
MIVGDEPWVTGIHGWDVVHSRPLTLGIALTESGHHPALAAARSTASIDVADRWIDLTARDDVAAQPTIVRVQATDLREAQRRTAEIRSDVAEHGGDPAALIVLVDLEVMTACDSRGARKELARLDSMLSAPRTPASLLYVGTPTGLAGLIADIHAVNVADGVTLLPLVQPGVLGDIAAETIPWLQTLGFELAREQTDFIHRCRLMHSGAETQVWGHRRSQLA